MSALPELPPYVHLVMDKYNIHDWDYLYKIMREYGDARAAHARQQALDEAAKCAEGYPKYGEATAEEIRSLK